jgi:hypothetical protein
MLIPDQEKKFESRHSYMYWIFMQNNFLCLKLSRPIIPNSNNMRKLHFVSEVCSTQNEITEMINKRIVKSECFILTISLW